jgi:ATP-binding cassette subfamily B protein
MRYNKRIGYVKFYIELWKETNGAGCVYIPNRHED